MTERCENCRFVLELEKDNFVCRRYPPIPVSFVDAYEGSAKTGGRKVAAHGCQCPVNHNWWCGEWKPMLSNLQ